MNEEETKAAVMEIYLKYGEREFEGPLLQGSHRPAVERVRVTRDSFGRYIYIYIYKLTPKALELIRS